MALRRKGRRKPRTLEDIAASLPARFMRLDVDAGSGEQNGLRDYMRDLEAHISKELGKPASQFHAAVVMEKLGISPAVWTAQALGREPLKKPFHTTADRMCAGCCEVKPSTAFDGPIYPGEPHRNRCRPCVKKGVFPAPDLRSL